MDKILSVIFGIIFLLLLPLGEIFRIDFANNISVSGLDLGVFCLVLFGGIRLLIVREYQHSSLLKPMLFFTAACVLSLIVNGFMLTPQELLSSALYLVRWLMYAGVYLIVVQNISIKKYLPRLMIFSGLLVLLIGYTQFLFYPDLRNLEYLGWDVHLYRMFGSFLDPNFFGAFLILYFLFVLHVFFRSLSGFSQSEQLYGNVYKLIGKIFQYKKQLLLVVILFFILLAILLTYSRSAFLMLIVGLLVFFITQNKKKRIMKGLGILLVLGVMSSLLLTRRSEGTDLFRTTSIQARLGSSTNAVVLFERNPLFGVGFNAYRYAQYRYGLIGLETPYIDHGGAGTDNSWLFVLATTGIIGFLAFINMWGKVVLLSLGSKQEIVILLYYYISRKKNIRHIRLNVQSVYAPVVLSSSLALFVNCFFINSLFYPFIMLWMWVLISVTE